MIRIIGNGGHASVVRDVLRCAFGVAIDTEKDYFFVAVGDNRARKKEAEAAKGDPLWGLVHPRAYVAKSADVGAGSIIMAGAVIQPGAKIGRHVIVNSGAVIDHDSIVHDYAHIAPHATLCGCVEVGDGAWVGAGAVCVQGAKVEPWKLIKAGSLHKSKEWRENCVRLRAGK